MVCLLLLQSLPSANKDTEGITVYIMYKIERVKWSMERLKREEEGKSAKTLEMLKEEKKQSVNADFKMLNHPCRSPGRRMGYLLNTNGRPFPSFKNPDRSLRARHASTDLHHVLLNLLFIGRRPGFTALLW